MSDKLKFTAEDFAHFHWQGYPLSEEMREVIADEANAKFDDWLSKAVVVYDVEDQLWSARTAQHFTNSNFPPKRKGLLINIEPIPAKVCEHKESDVVIREEKVKHVHEPVAWYIRRVYECGKCGRKINPKWEVAE